MYSCSGNNNAAKNIKKLYCRSVHNLYKVKEYRVI